MERPERPRQRWVERLGEQWAERCRRAARAAWDLLRAALLFAAALGVLRLAAAETEFRRDTATALRRAASSGNSAYALRWAEIDPARAVDILSDAVRGDPQSADVWIALGLAAEHRAQEIETQAHEAQEPEIQPRPAGERRERDRAGKARPRLKSAGVSSQRSAGDGPAAQAITQARAAFETAFRVDRQYAPAWALANFCFRHGDAECFWRAAERAALRAPSLAEPSAVNLTDLVPLLDLGARMEPSPAMLLDHLSAGAPAWRTACFERAYLDRLIGEQDWTAAIVVARRLLGRKEPVDTPRFDDFVNRLLAAAEGPAPAPGPRSATAASEIAAAMEIWNDYAGFPALAPERGVSLTNGDFGRAPRGAGFDWRLSGRTAEAGRPGEPVEARWKPDEAEFRFPVDSFTAKPVDQALLAEQWLPVRAGSFRLRFEYATRDFAGSTGIRWELGADAAAHGRTLAPAEHWRAGEWTFAAPRAGLARLRLVYRREAGLAAAHGSLEVRRVRLEVL